MATACLSCLRDGLDGEIRMAQMTMAEAALHTDPILEPRALAQSNVVLMLGDIARILFAGQILALQKIGPFSSGTPE